MLLSEAMQSVFDPEDTSVNGPNVSTSFPSRRTSGDTILRMLSPIEPSTTGAQILRAIKASHGLIIADDMLRAAERDNKYNASNTLSLLDHTLNCLRDFYRPELGSLKHNINSESSLEVWTHSCTETLQFCYTCYQQVKRLKERIHVYGLERLLDKVEQTLRGFQLLKIRINEADYSTSLARTFKLLGEWAGEEYASTCIINCIFDIYLPSYGFSSWIYFDSYLDSDFDSDFDSDLDSYLDAYRRTFNKPDYSKRTLPPFAYNEAPFHNECFNDTWVPLISWPNYPSRRLLNHYVRELPCANYPPAAAYYGT